MTIVTRVLSGKSAAKAAVSLAAVFVPLLFLASTARSMAAQQTENVVERMEHDRRRFLSGSPVNVTERLLIARQQMQAMIGSGSYPASVLSRRWQPLGPDRVISGQSGSRVSGRVSALAIHPRDRDVIFIGAAQGGVWRTTDAGASWVPLTDRECSLAMGSIAIDPVNPDIVYAGTGEQHFSVGSYYGCGVLRSLDGGLSWQQLGSDVFIREPNPMGSRTQVPLMGGARISRVHVDPLTAGSATSTVVLVASTFGLFRSTDSGASWSSVLSGMVSDLVQRPGDPSRLYAAVHGDGVYESLNGGLSWNRVPLSLSGPIRRINLAIAPSAPDILYAAVVHDWRDLRLYRSDDGGQNWRSLEARGTDCRQCGYNLTIAVDPDNPERVYLGEVLLYLSVDGGVTFRNILRDMHVDQHLLVFDTRSGNNILYVANDGGVYRSTDGADSFESLSTNLATIQFYKGISPHPRDPNLTLGGTQDNGCQLLSSNTATAVWIGCGDGGFTAFDAENPDVYYYVSGGPRKNGILARAGIPISDRGGFSAPLVMDPMDSRRLYFGWSQLYRTDNSAESWSPILEVPERAHVFRIAASVADSNTVYIALFDHRDGRAHVFVTRDGGATWSNMTQGLPTRPPGDLAIHPDHPEEAYLVMGGFLSGHVFRTTDGGRTWEDRSGNLPDMPVNAVLYDPADPAGVYIGTDLGVFYSSTGGGTWTPLVDGFPMVAVFDLAAQPGTGRLVAATHGRGMFEIPIDIPLVARTRPVAVTDSVLAAVDTTVAGTVIVAPSGRSDYAAAWTAEADAPWLSLRRAEGIGRGRFDYEASARALRPGTHTGSITVSLGGGDSRVIPVAVTASYWSTVAAPRTGARTSVPEGYAKPLADSLAITFDGPRAALTEWTATRSGRRWGRLLGASGTGDGVVTWGADVAELKVGTYVDTVSIFAPLADGSPVTFLDTLVVEPRLAVTRVQASEGVGVSGLDLAPGDSLSAGLTGFGADSAVWTARTGAPWLTLTRTSGGRSDPITWTRSAAAVGPGIHVDTITVVVEGNSEIMGLIVDRFRVQEPIGVETAALHLLGQESLASGQVEFLDWLGNQDGVLNAGDILKWLHHCVDSGDSDGCVNGGRP